MRIRALYLLAGCAALVAAAPEGAADSLADQFRALAPRIPYLNLSSALYDRQPGRSYRRQLWSEDEAAAATEVWRLARSAEEDAIAGALRDRDPKVRTLGLLAAHWSGDPGRWLESFVEMAGDDADTYRSLADRSAAFFPPPKEKPDPAALRERETFEGRTVGQFAEAMAKSYLSASGYSYGIKGSPPRHPGFADYWEKHRDREHCLGWFKVGLQIASEGSSSVGDGQRRKIAALRARIDAVPSPDREWILLSLATPWEGGEPEAGGAVLAGEEDLVAALRRLGRDSLLALFRRHQISDDPDMAIHVDIERSAFKYDRVTLFALRHPEVAFGAEDTDLFLKLAEEEGKSRFATPRWWTAAAQLSPGRAAEILDAAEKRFAEGDGVHHQDNRAMIAVARWQHLGAEAIPQIVDWFYSDEPSRGAGGFGRHRMCDFMWGEGRRELLFAVLRDERLDELDWGTLSKIVHTGIVHADPPPVDGDGYQDAWHPYGVSHYHWKRGEAAKEHPKETAELENVLAGWREKLRAYAGGE